MEVKALAPKLKLAQQEALSAKNQSV